MLLIWLIEQTTKLTFYFCWQAIAKHQTEYKHIYTPSLYIYINFFFLPIIDAFSIEPCIICRSFAWTIVFRCNFTNDAHAHSRIIFALVRASLALVKRKNVPIPRKFMLTLGFRWWALFTVYNRVICVYLR